MRILIAATAATVLISVFSPSQGRQADADAVPLVLAQVINGETMDDHAYAPTPPARWHAPSGEPQPSDLDMRAGDGPDARTGEEPQPQR